MGFCWLASPRDLFDNSFLSITTSDGSDPIIITAAKYLLYSGSNRPLRLMAGDKFCECNTREVGVCWLASPRDPFDNSFLSITTSDGSAAFPIVITVAESVELPGEVLSGESYPLC